MKTKIILFFILCTFFWSVSFPATTEAKLGDQLLKKGMKNEDVVELQQYLLAKRVYPYPEATGYFGPITEEAVKKFQEKVNIRVDGIVGPNTSAKLKLVKKGNLGKPVIEVQKLLKEWNLYTSKVDGLFGNGTKNAIATFQSKNGLTVDGIAGPQTLSKLRQKSAAVSTTEQTLTVDSTAYTASCEGCTGITSTGIDLNKYPEGLVIAVDPNVIPIGSTVEVEGYGKAVAGDVGGGINGNEIDVFISDHDRALEWGRKKVNIKVMP